MMRRSSQDDLDELDHFLGGDGKNIQLFDDDEYKTPAHNKLQLAKQYLEQVAEDEKGSKDDSDLDERIGKRLITGIDSFLKERTVISDLKQ